MWERVLIASSHFSTTTFSSTALENFTSGCTQTTAAVKIKTGKQTVTKAVITIDHLNFNQVYDAVPSMESQGWTQ